MTRYTLKLQVYRYVAEWQLGYFAPRRRNTTTTREDRDFSNLKYTEL